ncbi:DNA-directed RNA polymerase sigma-70 factor [Nocardioides flavus (ex Wang et al. 2016)]|uniref:DNA-directed RNA polymerase sigma-70 factor n=1 Tax=Nocardioides flavus (ex Wang et al. 2016) TaxID=2058780 RepID=A0ABQ3HKH4_9ACTN|nr:SigE family RNA polymerase sigma factor [Nocardioides flavus (ex Wang et al. 2016)]GHE16589.1 DNA-directed RNA polymerase sigma-70 factor [Nocardioides flavus (ex Wang et al. 2016)]
MARRDDDFVEFVDSRSTALLRTARLLTAGDQHAAEDLLQIALERAYVAWPRIQRKGAQEAYVRSIMTRAAIDRTRQRGRRSEVVTDDVPDVAFHQVGPEDRDQVFTLLASLSPRQRAVMVLRYYDDLSEAQIADALGCSAGAVKSHASRALAIMRGLTADTDIDLAGVQR